MTLINFIKNMTDMVKYGIAKGLATCVTSLS